MTPPPISTTDIPRAATAADSDPRRRAPAIETRGLHKTFGGEVALAGIDLRVERGTVYGVLGLTILSAPIAMRGYRRER